MQVFWRDLKFGFTSIVGNSTVKPKLVLYNIVLAADAEFVKPSKFIQYLEPKPSNTSQIIYSSYQLISNITY